MAVVVRRGEGGDGAEVVERLVAILLVLLRRSLV